MIHFDDFVFDVGCSGNIVIFGRGLRGTNQYIAHTDFAGIALTVISGKFFNQLAGKVIFLIHKHPVPGDKDIVQNNQGLMPAE